MKQYLRVIILIILYIIVLHYRFIVKVLYFLQLVKI